MSTCGCVEGTSEGIVLQFHKTKDALAAFKALKETQEKKGIGEVTDLDRRYQTWSLHASKR